MKKLLTLTFASAALLAFSAELKTWNFDSERDLMGDRIHAYAAKGSLVEKSLSSEKTPDGASVLKISLKQIAPGAPSHAIQLNFIYNKPLEKGKKYRIQFYCKGTKTGDISLLPALGGSPYSVLGQGAGRTLRITPEWQLFTLDFTMELEPPAKPNFVLPRTMLAAYPEGGDLFFGPVVFSEAPEVLPLALGLIFWQIR